MRSDFYRHVIQQEITDLKYKFAKRPANVPAVLSPQEVSAILNHLSGKYWFITALLYGCGFRIREVLRLRIKYNARFFMAISFPLKYSLHASR